MYYGVFKGTLNVTTFWSNKVLIVSVNDSLKEMESYVEDIDFRSRLRHLRNPKVDTDLSYSNSQVRLRFVVDQRRI